MMRILVADDDTISRTLLVRTLERAGYEVTAVGNGKLAAECLCGQDGPRLALLDWVMPELNGPEVCREVRQKREQPYVHMVLLTSKESKQDVVAGLESGADDYLIKPFDPAELKARLRTGLRILQLEDKLVEAREDMRFKATHDPLTGLFNRGVIVDLLAREVARTKRDDSCGTVLLGDVDHFKSVNDTRGHVVGDEVLREISRRILASVRSYDYVGRYGGEEFLVVLNNCDASSSASRAEQIRQAIADAPVQTAWGAIPVTMSFGVLSTRDCGLRSVEEVLHEVDAALYQAKATGRNCIRFTNPNPLRDDARTKSTTTQSNANATEQ
jgi:two-component system, cell cycle response regulator